MKLTYNVISLILVSTILCFSQEEEKTLENIFENVEIQEGAEEIFNLEELKNLEINLNSADYDELIKIPFFDFYLISNFLNYRNTYKQLISFYELLEIEGFTEDLVRKMEFFCVLDFIDKDILYFTRNSNEILIRDKFILEKREGFLNGNYKGNNHKAFFRYNFLGSEYLKFGINLEKDEGEQGIDYYSAYLEINKINNFLDIYVGDFHAEFGYGFSLWTGYKINKNLTDVFISTSRGFRRHTGTEENKFLRGIATKFYYKEFNLYIFTSMKNVDANAENDTVRSFLFTGLHRTNNEISNKHSVEKIDIGTNLEYKNHHLNFSFLTTYTKLNKIFYPEYKLYRIHSFLGYENFINSFSYNYKIDNLVIFGENGISNDDGIFVYNGLFIYPIHGYKFLVSHRYLNKKYFSFYNVPFSNYPNSEKGFFFNFSANPITNIFFVGYIDFYKNNWIMYNLNSLVWSGNFAIQATYKINYTYDLSLRFTNRDIPSNNSLSEEKIQNVIYNDHKSIRLDFNISKKNISLRTRIENVFYKDYNNKTNGFLFYQNIKFSFPNYEKINFYLRYSIFNSEEWNTRIYAYEDDFIGVFSSNTYYNKGNRYYFMIKYDYIEKIQFWFKISQTIYYNQYLIGSNNDRIQGNKISEIKLQINIKI